MHPRVLVVSASETERSLLRAALAQEQYVLSMAESAADALAEMAVSPPDLVLVDAVLPDMGGVDLLGSLTRQNATAHMPVIIMAQRDDAAIVAALEAGAVDVLYKPLSADVLRARMRNMLHSKAAIGVLQSVGAAAGATVQSARREELGLAWTDDRIRPAARVCNQLIYQWRPSDDTLEWFGDCARSLGYSSEEMPRTLAAWSALVHPDDRASLDEAIRRRRGSLCTDCAEYRVRDKSGVWRRWTDAAAPVVDSGGALLRWISVGTDITHCKWFEERLKRYGQIVDNAIDAIAILDPQGYYIEQNHAHEALFGYSSEELRGRTPALQFGEAVFSEISSRLAKDGFFNGEVIGTKKSDIPISVEVSAFPVLNERGEVTCYVEFERDITERKQAEQAAREQAAALEEFNRALEEANIAADAANRAKSEFLANMSHEIRTPMTAILGFAEVLLGDPTKEEIAKAAQTIYRNGEHLLEIINGILDLSMIEAGKMNLERVAYSPRQLISDVASLMRGRAEAKGLSLDLEFQDDIPQIIQTDPARLRQILINLVGNAIKFTEHGGVRVVTQNGRTGSRGPTLQFDVIDTGIGMEQEQVARLFQPFTQGDTSTRRKFGGSGLGLVISKRLAQMLGGTITVASIPGKGSTFTATVAVGPFEELHTVSGSSEVGQKRRRATPQVSDTPDRLSCRVLLAEDGVDNQRLLSLILQKAGAEVTIAADGKSAVEAIQAATAPFDLVLMDMQMPIMDGYEATRFLRAAGYTIPIIALTAHAMKGDREKCLEVGCDDYLTKPISRKLLLSAVATYAAKRREQAAAQATDI